MELNSIRAIFRLGEFISKVSTNSFEAILVLLILLSDPLTFCILLEESIIITTSFVFDGLFPSIVVSTSHVLLEPRTGDILVSTLTSPGCNSLSLAALTFTLLILNSPNANAKVVKIARTFLVFLLISSLRFIIKRPNFIVINS